MAPKLQMPPVRVLPTPAAARALGQLLPDMGGMPGSDSDAITSQHEPGGLAVAGMVNPSIQIMKWGWRVLPEESFFSNAVTPQSPLQFELGSFQVPKSVELWLFDYETSVYRFSGLDPADWIKAEVGRFSGVMGFDLTINSQTRPGNVRFEIDPHNISGQKQMFSNVASGGLATVADFNRAAANSFAATASPGLALFPPSRDRLGPRNGPFTYVIPETMSVALSCVIFRPITSPIACIEGIVAGYLVDRMVSQQIQRETIPR